MITGFAWRAGKTEDEVVTRDCLGASGGFVGLVSSDIV